MSLYLARHGSYLSPEQDPEKGLSDQGKKEVNYVANIIKNKIINLSKIKHSSKKRARQTADIMKNILKPINGIEEIPGINPYGDVTVFAENIKAQKNEMFIGHLPFMEKLVSYLITGSPDKTIIEFPIACVTCLDIEINEWVIKWSVIP